MEVRREERREAGRDRGILVAGGKANPRNEVIKHLEEKQEVSWTRMAWSKRLACKAENRHWFSVVVDNTTRILILLLNLPSKSSRYTPHTHFPHSACPLGSQVTWWLPTLTSASGVNTSQSDPPRLCMLCISNPRDAEQWKRCHSVASIVSVILEVCILKPESWCAEIQASWEVARSQRWEVVVRSRLFRVPHLLMIRRWRTHHLWTGNQDPTNTKSTGVMIMNFRLQNHENTFLLFTGHHSGEWGCCSYLGRLRHTDCD